MVFRTGARARPTRSTVDAMPRDARRQRARARVARARDDARASTNGAALRDASMATRSRGFPPAARPDVVRAAQKDETHAAVRLPDARATRDDARDATTRRRDDVTTLTTDDATRRDATRRARRRRPSDCTTRARARSDLDCRCGGIARCGRAGGRRTRR